LYDLQQKPIARRWCRINRARPSVCTLVFVAGRTRSLGPEGRLGFHGYKIESKFRVQTLDIAAEQSRDRAYFRSRGVAAWFLDRAYRTLPPGLWVPSRDALRKSRVISK